MSDLRPILLVDDDPRDVELTMIALGKHNLRNRVVNIHDGEQAIAYLLRTGEFASLEAPDPIVVLLDLKMPKVDGLEVLRAVRSHEQTCHLPVVILTSSSEERDVVESYKLGVNAYVPKPVEFHAFVDAVSELGAFWAILNEPPPPVETARKGDLDERHA